jgi:shikimate kinase
MKNRQNIVLIGMSGVGKTFLGKYASINLGLPFFDTDEIIQRTHNAELKGLVQDKSWSWFRNEEYNVLKELVKFNGVIISTGGGIIENPLVENLLEKQKVIYIKRDVTSDIKVARHLTASYDILEKERAPTYKRLAQYVYINESSSDDFLNFITNVIK